MKKIFCYIFIFNVALLTNTTAQHIDAFQKTIGGFNDDAGVAIPTADGGYIIGGQSSSFSIMFPGLYDLYLTKMNHKGQILWSYVLGDSLDDIGWTVIQTADGGYAIAGHSSSFSGGFRDFYLVKTNSSGIVTWSKTFDSGFSEQVFTMQQTSDGGYILAGEAVSAVNGYTEIYVVKTDASGNMQWSNYYGGNSSDDVCYSVKQTTDGGYILAGSTQSFGAGQQDFYLIKLTATGNVSWSKTYGGILHEFLFSAFQTSDGGYMLAGESTTFKTGPSGSADYLIIKTDNAGNVQWSKNYGSNATERANHIVEVNGGGYTITGMGLSASGTSGDITLVRIDASGNIIWSRGIGGSGQDWGMWVENTSDNGFIISGSTGSFAPTVWNTFIVKTDSNGFCGCNEAAINFSVGNATVTVSSPTTILTTPTTTEKSVTTKQFSANTTLNTQCECNIVAHATGDTIITKGESTTLTASASGGTPTNFLWSGGSTTQSIIVSPSITTTYSVIVTDKPCQEIAYITVEVELPCGEIMVPSAFSPNNDGQNDILNIYGNCYSSLLLQIYDRWGEKVFETNDIAKGWDGKLNGNTFNTGIFVYNLMVSLEDETTINKQGNISLIR